MAELISLERTGRWSLKLIDQVEVGSGYAVVVGSNVTVIFLGTPPLPDPVQNPTASLCATNFTILT